MDLKSNFVFKPLPEIKRPLLFSLTNNASTLGPLADLPGTWKGRGFNMIWRPNNTPGQDRFLELNLTDEQIEFSEIPGSIPNRGLLQADIEMFGVRYLQSISDLNNGAGLHIEPGIWATVPLTSDPSVPPTVVRMASIPHGTTLLAQGLAMSDAGAPQIDPVDITPFVIGQPTNKINFPEPDLSQPTQFRSPPADIVNITQAIIDNPNSVLVSALTGQTVKHAVVLQVSSNPTTPVIGGGTANTAFLQGAPGHGPNANAAEVTSTFWIETIEGAAGSADFLQIQYTQTVLLNFNGLSWPHITVGTLLKSDL
ncbi:heme-binding protein [Rhizobium ruizarguesonis]|uniref:heme-binding protein n=1 Tax=Rhizobium ruizarguesonis TaxID=2081791 RepID=UPI001CF28F4F|nr:heme-binding protein [Rhizobium ruizarguesonis]MCB2399349.1 FABP family protein [Rhizobium ruizarguesonis]